MKWIDIHTHKAYKADADVIFIRNAYMAAFEPKNPNYFISNGIHPWKINQAVNPTHLRQLLSMPKTVALGEIGLDRFKPNFERQKILFEQQIQIGHEYSKPLILHCIKAYPEVISMIKEYKHPVIFHQYEGNPLQTEQLLTMPHVYFAFGRQLFRNTLNKNLNSIPMRRIFLETDNTQIPIQNCYYKLSQLLQLNISQIQVQLQTNFENIFGNMNP